MGLFPRPMGEGKGEGAAFTLAEGATHVGNCANYRKSAFTLAEVLITLAIIGVVAAMTIPTLISDYQEKVTVAKLKRLYSTISRSFLYSVAEYGEPNTWSTSRAPEEYDKFLNNLSKNLKVAKTCKATQPSEECFAKGFTTVSLANIEHNDYMEGHSKLITTDGTMISITVNSPTCEWSSWYGAGPSNNICGGLHIAINGQKDKQILGKDVFLFYVTKNGIIPAGDARDKSEFEFSRNCTKSKIISAQGTQNGLGCTAWVIQNGNMDYLHCDDLSWTGKHKCSD